LTGADEEINQGDGDQKGTRKSGSHRERHPSQQIGGGEKLEENNWRKTGGKKGKNLLTDQEGSAGANSKREGKMKESVTTRTPTHQISIRANPKNEKTEKKAL